MVRFKKLQIISWWAWLYHDTWLLKFFVVHIFSAFILEFRLPEKKRIISGNNCWAKSELQEDSIPRILPAYGMICHTLFDLKKG